MSTFSYDTTMALLAGVVTLSSLIYLILLNRLFRGVPDELHQIAPRRWTTAQIQATAQSLVKQPINTKTFAPEVPPRLERRYIVTGGSGLVGGHIILQLLERGQPPEAIRNLDFQQPHRSDQLQQPRFTRVQFTKTDISSSESVKSAFAAPWNSRVADMPLTVLHTAAVIIPSDRSPLTSGFIESVNVLGTSNVLATAQSFGADIFVSTTSASISVRPVELWVKPWRLNRWPRNFVQALDDSDFDKPIRPRQEFYSNYSYSKAVAERLVCAANSKTLRTGCIRPANGVYGHPSDNMIGTPLNNGTQPNWIAPMLQNNVHGANCAVAHLKFEAILAAPNAWSCPQAGRPFVITDPNPPIAFSDMYTAIASLVPAFSAPGIPPAIGIVLAYIVEFFNLLPFRVPPLRPYLPRLRGDIKHLQPAVFSICTHLVADDTPARRSVANGGLGYTGSVTTMKGMVQEIIDWKHEQDEAKGSVKAYISSVTLADEIESHVSVASPRPA